MEKISKKEKKSLWKQPWGYRESFLVAFEILLIGFIIEILNKGRGLITITKPYNIIIGVVFIGIIFIIHNYFRSKKIIKWLSSVQAAVSAITLFCLLSLLLGFIPQNPKEITRFIDTIGLTHVQRSWPMLLSEIYLLIVLGLVALRRLKPFNLKNSGFFLNHAGLWITLFAITLGSGDLLRMNMKLTENKPATDIVYDNNLKLFSVPFKVELLDFQIEEYPPKIALINTETKKILLEAPNNLTLIEEGLVVNINNWQVEIEKYYVNSIIKNNEFIESDVFGASASVLMNVKNTITGKEIRGWLSPGGMMNPSIYLELDNSHSIALTSPEAKEYSSIVVIENIEKNTIDTATIEVNKPVKVNGWNLYQVGYDEKMGKWSSVSFLEVVFDPWLPVIYFGIFLLIAGAIYMIWIGKDK
ncbi:cytochrome c biogenesis protein ResB [Bacteroidota bacterium]